MTCSTWRWASAHQSGQRRRQRSGFTLVELLVVIGIIALLISVLLPVLNSARRQARIIQCASAMRQFGQANQMYVNEQRGWCVPVKTATGVIDPELDSPLTYIPWYMNPVMRRRLMMPVPPRTQTGSGSKYKVEDWSSNWPRELLCPEAVVSQQLRPGTVTHSYGWNRETLGRFPNKETVSFGNAYAVKITQVRRPAEKIQMIDGNWFYLDGPNFLTPADWRAKWDVYGDREPSTTNPITVSYRHKQGANVLFFDGHVSWMRKQEIHGNDVEVNKKLWNILDSHPIPEDVP